MKATGIIRRIDDLGRVVIPKETRRSLGIKDGDPIEIFVDGEYIVLKKYSIKCIFCGEEENLLDFKDKLICKNCVNEVIKCQ